MPNIQVPTPHLALSGLRIYEKGAGSSPAKVNNLAIDRHEDRRDITLTWEKIEGAQGYNIKWGIAPDKLYSSWLVYGQNEHHMKSPNRDQSYCFAIESFNENGFSEHSEIVEVK